MADADIEAAISDGRGLSQQDAGELISKLRKKHSEPESASGPGPEPESEHETEDLPTFSDSLEDVEIEEAPADAPAVDLETPIQSLNDLAETLDIDTAALNDLEFSFKAAGEDVTVPLDELQRGYQRQADYTRKQQDLADRQRTAEAAAKSKMDELERQNVQFAQMLQQGKQLLVGQINNNVEMQQLRTANPAEYAARAMEYQQRMAAVDQLYNAASAQFDRYQSEQSANTQAKAQERAQSELAKLQAAIPDWSQDLSRKISVFLRDDFGFSAEEIDEVVDSRLIVIADEARKYREMKQVGAKTKKKVNKLPKVSAPSQGTKPINKRQSNIDAAKKRLQKTGKARDAGALIQQLRGK